MIKLKLNYNDEQISSFTVEGHANAGKFGEDIVCSAVTAVTVGTVNAIERLAKLHPIETYVEYNQNGGYLKFEAPTNVDEETHKIIQTLLQGMVVSLETIELDNKKYMKINHHK
ncbi:MAG: hypothetical protein K0R71_2243 [Bacillales bacterium]|jgi:uncharacterized protein YsxB (DUF464 family)|nr:hypothetical protein [Bacillales bacterium]